MTCFAMIGIKVIDQLLLKNIITFLPFFICWILSLFRSLEVEYGRAMNDFKAHNTHNTEAGLLPASIAAQFVAITVKF